MALYAAENRVADFGGMIGRRISKTMFQKVGDAEFVRGEHQMLKFWNERAIFAKLRQQNAGKDPWSFLDGLLRPITRWAVHLGRTYKTRFSILGDEH